MTDEERYEKLNDKLDKILDKLSNKLEGVSRSLQDHEVRIVVLETKSPTEKRDWRTDIIKTWNTASQEWVLEQLSALEARIAALENN